VKKSKIDIIFFYFFTEPEPHHFGAVLAPKYDAAPVLAPTPAAAPILWLI
jgi:hypothetical protein